MDQSSFAAPHGFSQRITSFFACACQGIHQMPLRHLIVLIAYAHQYSRFCFQNRRKGYLLQPNLLMMTSTCSTHLLDWGHAERPACRYVFKTSFSRLIQDRAVRQRPSVSRQRRVKTHQQRPTRVTGFLPTSDPSTRSDRLGHPWFHWNRARTWVIKPTPGSLQINLLFTIFAEQAALHRSDANLFFFRRQCDKGTIKWLTP